MILTTYKLRLRKTFFRIIILLDNLTPPLPPLARHRGSDAVSSGLNKLSSALTHHVTLHYE